MAKEEIKKSKKEKAAEDFIASFLGDGVAEEYKKTNDSNYLHWKKMFIAGAKWQEDKK